MMTESFLPQTTPFFHGDTITQIMGIKENRREKITGV